jgi:RND family efflux transporter MFP subunit
MKRCVLLILFSLTLVCCGCGGDNGPVPMVDELIVPGSVEARNDVTLYAGVSGNVVSRAVEEGAAVANGQVILQIENSAYRERFTRAEADAELARQNFARITILFQQGVVSQSAYDEARLQLALAEAALMAAEAALNSTTIRAPFDGVLNSWMVETNEFVGMGDPLAQIVDTSVVRVTIQVPEEDIVFVHEGTPVTAFVNNLPDKQYEGVLYYVSTTIDMATRTFEAKFELTNDDKLLEPGMILNVHVAKQPI